MIAGKSHCCVVGQNKGLATRPAFWYVSHRVRCCITTVLLLAVARGLSFRVSFSRMLSLALTAICLPGQLQARPVPEAPGNLKASAMSAFQVRLTWADNSRNEDGFKIERSTDATNFTQIAQVPA